MKYSENIGSQLAQLANDYIKEKDLVWSKDEIPIKAVFENGDKPSIDFVVDNGKEPNSYNTIDWILIGKTKDGDVCLKNPASKEWMILDDMGTFYWMIDLIGFHRKGFRP